MSDRSPSIVSKFVLYSHYGAHEAADRKAFEKGVNPDDWTGVCYLEDHFGGLRELLTTPGHEGLLVLFYAPGYAQFLHAVAEHKGKAEISQAELLADYRELQFADKMAECVRRKLKAARLSDRVRFVTSLDLAPILGRVNAILAEVLPKYLQGDVEGMKYDAPKIPEAILRLRLLGNGVPVLRLDHDVIFRDDNKGLGELGLFKAVACALRAYRLRTEAPTVSNFLFSASYNARALFDRPPVMDLFEGWSQAFATRVYPALIADPDKIKEISEKSSDQQDFEWNVYVREHLNETVVRQYYGLKDTNDTLDVDGTRGLTSIGAHPLYAVISGALLCLSDGAILDLPPFSNFRTNVMWIDDHLKYSLHRAIYHFTSGETLDLEPGLRDARLDDVRVTKARPGVSNLPAYVFGSYLPTLLWGAVMDAWINADPILKCRASRLDPKDRECRNAALDQQGEAPLPHSMLRALATGHFAEADQKSLREKLRDTAVRRIEQVRQLWARLKAGKQETFAAYWAEGRVAKTFPPQCFQKCADELWQGISKKHVQRITDLTPAMIPQVGNLIDDAVTYVNWTLEWPRFVQIVRSIRQGTFIGDLTWRDPSSILPDTARPISSPADPLA